MIETNIYRVKFYNLKNSTGDFNIISDQTASKLWLPNFTMWETSRYNMVEDKSFRLIIAKQTKEEY